MIIKRLIISILSIALLFLVFTDSCKASNRVKIIGEYQYTYGDNESLIEAKSICYSMAVRNAIESYKTFVIATSTVKDYKLIKDLIQTISSAYIEDLKIIEESVTGRTVNTKIEGYIVPSIIDNVLKREVQRLQGKEPEAIADNGYLKILKVVDSKICNACTAIKEVIVTYKVLRNTGSLYYSSEQNRSPQFKILIDYYDINGDTIGGDAKFIHYSSTEMVSGQIGTVKFSVPAEEALATARSYSYRVWLYDKQE